MAHITDDMKAAESDSVMMFRGPSTSPAKPGASFTPPPKEFLQGVWHVTHSTLPMWKSNRNITITYTPLDSPPGAIDDLVRYQPVNSDKEKTIHGIDTPDSDVQAKFGWRGCGWLKIASSSWEVLGFGDDEGGWAVTYFSKTLFTPAGIDIYARRKGGLSESLVHRVQAEIKKVDDAAFRAIADQIFQIQHN